MKTGVFAPPALVGPVPFADPQAMIRKAETALKGISCPRSDQTHSTVCGLIQDPLRRPPRDLRADEILVRYLLGSSRVDVNSVQSGWIDELGGIVSNVCVGPWTGDWPEGVTFDVSAYLWIIVPVVVQVDSRFGQVVLPWETQIVDESLFECAAPVCFDCRYIVLQPHRMFDRSATDGSVATDALCTFVLARS